ncbi:MAG: hypothetical protein A3E25_09885 [Burkholderiales bacterium RIFCSPHIGHO2_12_FULL_69_20]|nr:MAG: hypothetical protein A3E25_09885 [Burkholderiales bacterium RIFCSPHIGHO2_12_FULL_69_20]
MQVLAQLVEPDVGVEQRFGAPGRRQMPRGHQRVMRLQRQVHHMAAHGMAVLAREAGAVRHQPLQQLARARVNDHAVA